MNLLQCIFDIFTTKATGALYYPNEMSDMLLGINAI